MCIAVGLLCKLWHSSQIVGFDPIICRMDREDCEDEIMLYGEIDTVCSNYDIPYKITNGG
jgi:hypothetical protein